MSLHTYVLIPKKELINLERARIELWKLEGELGIPADLINITQIMRRLTDTKWEEVDIDKRNTRNSLLGLD